MVQVVGALCLEFLKGIEFGSYKREDGLLFVAKEDDGGGVGGKEVDDGQLEEVEATRC